MASRLDEWCVYRGRLTVYIYRKTLEYLETSGDFLERQRKSKLSISAVFVNTATCCASSMSKTTVGEGVA
jgi:Fe-S cluster assembly iron-binding protein IscA